MSKAPVGFADKLHSTYSAGDFDVIGDTLTALRAGVQLAMLYHSSFTHYRVVERGDGNEIHFLWTDSSDEGIVALPFPLKNVDAVVMFINLWIQENGIFPESDLSDGDGHDKHGFQLTNRQAYDDRQRSQYLALSVRPTYVYYGK